MLNETINESDGFPQDLLTQFEIIRELSVTSGQRGTIWLCADRRTDQQVAVKRFFRQVKNGASDPREDWLTLASEFVVPFIEPKIGQLGSGWFWEVLEYCPLGSLRDHLAPLGSRIPDGMQTSVISQLTNALDYLHGKPEGRIVHRDVKPDNILVRKADPLKVVLTDLGHAVSTTATVEFHSPAFTPLYVAPEARTGISPPAIDWWSLGMTLAEVCTGLHPFQISDGSWLPEVEMYRACADGAIPLDHVRDFRLRHLLSGLLTRDWERRWKAQQIREWLAGGAPEVYREELQAPRAVPPFRSTAFNRSFDSATQVAAAMSADWNAAGRLYSGMDLEELGAWLARRHPEIDVKDVLDGRGSASSPFRRVDRGIAELLVRLDPTITPSFRGRSVSPDELRRTARRAKQESSGADSSWLESLHASQALRAYAGHDQYFELADIDARWQSQVEQADRWFREVKEAGSMTPRVKAAILELAVERRRG